MPVNCRECSDAVVLRRWLRLDWPGLRVIYFDAQLQPQDAEPQTPAHPSQLGKQNSQSRGLAVTNMEPWDYLAITPSVELLRIPVQQSRREREFGPVGLDIEAPGTTRVQGSQLPGCFSRCHLLSTRSSTRSVEGLSNAGRRAVRRRSR